MKHWKMTNAVAAAACNVKITSLSWTGLTPPGWRSLYSSCSHVGGGRGGINRGKRRERKGKEGGRCEVR